MEERTYIYAYDTGFNMISEKAYAYTTEITSSGTSASERSFTYESASSSGRELRFSYDSVGNPVAVMYNDVEYYYVKNIQGDIIGLVDSSGAWVAEYSYDTWCRVISVTGTLAATLGQDNPLRYRGYFYDAETGLYYVSSRYYSSELCRFISADALISNCPSVISYNLYPYCGNNQVNNIDPTGTCYYNANGEWCHDNWEYLYGYDRKPEPIDLTEKLTSYMDQNAMDLMTYRNNNGMVKAWFYFIDNAMIKYGYSLYMNGRQ